jgi:integrase
VHNLKTEDLSPEQLATLIEVINEDHDYQAANFICLALCTGMRRGEIFKLMWADIDFERGYITIRGPKGGKDQIIRLNQAVHLPLGLAGGPWGGAAVHPWQCWLWQG